MVRHVLDHQRELAVFPHVHGVEIEFLAGILLAQAEGAVRIGEVDRAVALDHDVVGAAEALALVAVGQHGALAVLLDAHERAARKGGDDQPALAVERQAVRADHREFLELRIGALAAVVLDAAPAPDFRPVVADVAEIDRRLAVRRELPDHIARHVGEQEMPLPALLHPHWPFGEAEAPLTSSTLASGETSIERRIEPHDAAVGRGLSSHNALASTLTIAAFRILVICSSALFFTLLRRRASRLLSRRAP